MSISLKQAFCSVAQDAHWVSKVLIGSLLLFFPSFVYIFPGIRRLLFDPMNYYLIALFTLMALFINIAICGYFFKAVHNRIVHLKSKLPSWNYFTYYLCIGIKAYIGGFVFSLPFVLLSCITVYFAPKTLSVEIIPFIVFLLILHLIYVILYIMLALNFSMKFKISAFYNIKKAYKLIKDNLNGYVVLIFYCLLIAFFNTLTTLILVNAQIFALLIPFISFYVCLIYMDLFAQFALNCDKKKALKEKVFS